MTEEKDVSSSSSSSSRSSGSSSSAGSSSSVGRDVLVVSLEPAVHANIFRDKVTNLFYLRPYHPLTGPYQYLTGPCCRARQRGPNGII